jgi:hypothetical protein
VEKEKGEEMEWAGRDEMWRWARHEGRGRDKFFPFSFSCSILFYFSFFLDIQIQN